MKRPLISVVIVNFNGKKWLKACINSIKRQTYKKFEIIFVDNGSTDSSVSFVVNNYPDIFVIKNTENVGFAEGNNIGVSSANGEYIVLLNNDTTVSPDYFKYLIQAFEDYPNLAIAQSKIVLMNSPEKLDTCGGFWTSSSFLYYYGNDKDASLPQYNKAFQVFTVKAASVMIKKSVIDKIGLFDADFWSYYEETDFCHRAWLSGYECWYWPDAECKHAMGGTSRIHFDRNYIQFHNFKNKLSSFIKNFELNNLVWVIPIYICLNILISLFWLIKGKWRNSISIYRAIIWNVLNINSLLVKRKKVQQLRVKRDGEYLATTTKNPSIRYYLALLTDNFSLYEDK